MKMEKIFLHKVYRYNKKLFFLFLAFALFTLFCNLTGFEITPFYVWGMYSQKEAATKEYPVFRIKLNGKLVDYSSGYFPANRFFLQSPLAYYSETKHNVDPTLVFLNQKLEPHHLPPYFFRVFNSKKDIEEFPSWFRRYLQQTTGKKVNSLKVDVLKLSYENNDSIKINSVYNLVDEK